jgi:signal transduction histidine kinase
MRFPPAPSPTVTADEPTFPRAPTLQDRAAWLSVAGGLVASVTHDLRQPLTALEMNIAAAMHCLQLPAPRADEAMDALHDALIQQARMRESLQVLHDLAVPREPVCEVVDIVPILHDVVALVGNEVMARHATLELDVCPPVPAILGEATLLRHALINMVLDALESTSLSHQPDRRVVLAARQVEDSVELTVTHLGLRPEAANVDDWGLALARSVVKAHRGTMTLEGDADAGVRLVTRWPIPHPTVEGAAHA